jgi:hypothetical protein
VLTVPRRITGALKVAKVAVVVFALLVAVSYAATPPGTPYRGGIYLYEQIIERYRNEWVAYTTMAAAKLPTKAEASIQIKGEGKTVEFSGIVIINCANGRHVWKSASNFGTALKQPGEIQELVPPQVMQNAAQLFCKK